MYQKQRLLVQIVGNITDLAHLLLTDVGSRDGFSSQFQAVKLEEVKRMSENVSLRLAKGIMTYSLIDFDLRRSCSKMVSGTIGVMGMTCHAV